MGATYTVKALAELAGITVRTLHHYDRIGLFRPSRVSEAGYRLYSDADLDHLQQVLFFRELGLGLTEIKEIVARPGFDRRHALREHRALLLARRERLDNLIALVDRTLDAQERGITMEKQDMFKGFDQSAYEEEARQRWGHTDAYKESTRRVKAYTKEDWAAIQAETKQIEEGIATSMDQGRAPTDPQVQEWLERWHKLVNDRFYQCTPEMIRATGEMYVSDPRFTAYYEKIRPGMAQFMRAAMVAHSERLKQAR